MNQKQMLLPLLDALVDEGSRGKTAVLYDAVAERIGISKDARDERVVLKSGATINAFERNCRWAMQQAKFKQLAEPIGNQLWRVTTRGKHALTEATPGKVVTVYLNDNGVALWCNSEDGIGLLDDNSVNLLFTSPPYPLLRKKEYGNVSETEYVDWFLRMAEQWPRVLARDGSIVINLGDVWKPGSPTLSTYQERLLVKLEDVMGLKLCQRFAWQNPSKMPAPAEWVTVRRIRVKPSLEQLYWLSPTGEPKANNRNVLTAYSDSMLQRIASGGESGAIRPSGHSVKAGAFSAVNGGAIPGNLLTAANTESNSRYITECRANDLPVHPARFPAALPSFFIDLTTDVGDTVMDPFAGSLTTCKVAQQKDRKWIGMDRVREYLEGGKLRFFEPEAMPLFA